MKDFAITGANGFLGWHTRTALREQSIHARQISLGAQFDSIKATNAISDSQRLIHIAGINRATDLEISNGNIQFAEQVAEALIKASSPPPVVVFANSIQSSNGSVYGEAKLRAAEILMQAAESIGATFMDVQLPNLFGEHGKPFYNSVTSTFCHLLASGETPTVVNDNELRLLHVQNAADLLTGAVSLNDQGSLEVLESVSGLLSRLDQISQTYASGEVPDISTNFERDLFNTYRSYTYDSSTPISLVRHADSRGSFFEIVRSRGGQSQTSFSTTAPGISRGDHFHRRKVERFTVLSGNATISLRKLFTDHVHHFEVTGDQPVAIDMPTGWAHKITNTGFNTLYTSFWSNEIYDPEQADTIAEAV